MKLPKTIKLLDADYKISFKNLERGRIGQINFKKSAIFIDESIKNCPKLIYGTLLHELGHYFGLYYDVGQSETFAQAFARFVILINKQIKFKNGNRKRRSRTFQKE